MTTTPFSAEGRYLILAEDAAGNLDVSLTDEGREELAYQTELHPEWTDFDHFCQLFADFDGNGWDILAPEEIGALTACDIIICPDVEHGDDGSVKECHGPVYWHERYQVESFADELRAGRTVTLLKASP